MTLKRIKNFEGRPNQWTDYFFQVGLFHLRVNTQPKFSVQCGWNCSFWYTGWFLSVSMDGVQWVWRETRDYAE